MEPEITQIEEANMGQRKIQIPQRPKADPLLEQTLKQVLESEKGSWSIKNPLLNQ